MALLQALLVGVVLAHTAQGQLYNDWIKTARTRGESISLNCSEWCGGDDCHPRGDAPPDSPVVAWMGPAPDLYVWPVNQSIPAAECASCNVSENGWEFHIEEFDPLVHIGVYHCMLQNQSNGQYTLIKWGVNMRGPYFEDLLEKYEQNIIIGISACGGFTFVAVSIILVYHFRWSEDPDEKKRRINNRGTLGYGSQAKTGGVVGVEVGVLESTPETAGTQARGTVNPAFTAEAPPQYNGIKTQVDEEEAGGSGSGSEAGSMRHRDLDPRGATPTTVEHQETKF